MNMKRRAKAAAGALSVLASVTAMTGVASGESAPRSERYIEKGRPAHGFLTLPHGERVSSGWVVLVRRGARSAIVKAGEGMSERDVTGAGEFRLKLLPGTYTFGARRRQLGEAGRLCGRTVVTVRAHQPIPVIRVRCRG